MGKIKKPTKPRLENERKLKIFLAKLNKNGKANN